MKRPKRFDPDYKGPNKSKRQESRLAKMLGGRRQPASGALDFAKGDVKTDLLLLEAKRTGKKSLGVKAEWLEKITREARAEGRIPALSIELPTNHATPTDWTMVPTEFLRDLLGGRDG